MKYTQIPATTFSEIQLNAGILCTSFTPATGEFDGLLGATTGGLTFTAAPSYSDYGDDIDNCPKNMKELKKQESVEASLSGTFVTLNASSAKNLMATADVDGNDATHIIPRKDILQTDFNDIWWIGDYSDVNTGENAGYIAIHLMNALNTGGFQIKSTDKGKGNFAFNYLAHFSMENQDLVPYELYIKGSSGTLQPSIYLNKHLLTLEDEATGTLVANTIPEDATITWSSSDTDKATVSGGEVTAKAEGSAIVTASITVDGVTYNDTCTVVVTAG